MWVNSCYDMSKPSLGSSNFLNVLLAHDNFITTIRNTSSVVLLCTLDIHDAITTTISYEAYNLRTNTNIWSSEFHGSKNKGSIRIVKDWQQGPCKSKESKEVALANKKMEDLNERKLTQLNTNFRSWFAINQTKDWQ
jgi:hypothetical protein